MTEKENSLKKFLEKLEASAEKILGTQGYNQRAERIRILEELIKEQVANANTRSTTRQTR